MSALPPKADIVQRQGDVRFGPQAAVSRRSKLQLFDHLVGAAKERQRDGEAERFSSL
jgi:hypothetical protein